MSTRAQIPVFNSKEKCIASIYKHSDGYPEGLGSELKTLLQSATIINGIGSDQNNPEFFNGMGCMAAWLTSKLKDGIGQVYLEHPIAVTDTDSWIEYFYQLYPEDGAIKLRLFGRGGKQIYDGYIRDFDPEKLPN